MLQPARRKYRKEQKGRNTGIATRGAAVSFRRLRPEGHRTRPPDRPPDRGGSPCDYPPHQARRPYLDPHLPGQADLAEARRSPYG